MPWWPSPWETTRKRYFLRSCRPQRKPGEYERRRRGAGVRQDRRGRSGHVVENLESGADIAEERLTGPDLHDTAHIDVRGGCRNLRTGEVQKVGVPKIQVGDRLLLEQLALA